MMCKEDVVGLSADGWRLLSHARERMDEMELDDETVLAALRDPDCRYPGDRKYRDGRTCLQKDHIVVVVNGSYVVTVLWHRAEGR